jgi:hypothetical protein
MSTNNAQIVPKWLKWLKVSLKVPRAGFEAETNGDITTISRKIPLFSHCFFGGRVLSFTNQHKV